MDGSESGLIIWYSPFICLELLSKTMKSSVKSISQTSFEPDTFRVKSTGANMLGFPFEMSC